MTHRAQTSDDMQAAAAAFAASLKPGDHATVVTLSGELGAGKTTFTQGLARALGVQETVASPTFVLEKIYALPAQAGLEGRPFTHLIHIDAYRLKDESELGTIGWREILAEPGNLVVLEWPENVAGAIPASAISIRFDIEGEGRIITMNYGEESGKEID